MTKKNLAPTLQLIAQGLITALYVVMTIHVSIFEFSQNGLEAFATLSFYLSFLVILLSSIVPPIVLRIRRKLHSEDGEVFPVLFLILSIQASLIVPIYVNFNGFYMIPPETLIIIERFSILATASMFLLAALEYYGFQNAKLNLYTLYILLACLIVALLAPFNTNRGFIDIYNAYSDAYILFGVFLLYIASALTFIISAINEKTTSNIRRCVAFLFMILGMILALINNMFVAIAASLFYLIGIIILCYNTRDSF